MTWRWARILIITAGVALGGSSCKHGDSTPPVVTPPPPPVTGAVDCSSAAVWTTTTFAGLVPSVQRALAQSNAQVGLDDLLKTHTNGEIACVASYVHDQSAQQAAAAPSDPLPGQRVAATEAWLGLQAQHGLTIKPTATTTTAEQKSEDKTGAH